VAGGSAEGATARLQRQLHPIAVQLPEPRTVDHYVCQVARISNLLSQPFEFGVLLSLDVLPPVCQAADEGK
jgi:hypothetical protein